MSFTNNASKLTGKSITNAFNVVADNITVEKNELVKGDLTVLGTTNIGNVSLQNGSVTNLTAANLTVTNSFQSSPPVPVASGGTGLSTLGSPNQVLTVNSNATGLIYQAIGLSNPSIISAPNLLNNPNISIGVESVQNTNPAAGKGVIRTSDQAFGFEVVTEGSNKFIKLETDTVTMNMASSKVSIPTVTESTSTTTGALVVSGGAGIAKDLYVGKKMQSETMQTETATAEVVNVSDVLNFSPFGVAPISSIYLTGRLAMTSAQQVNPLFDNDPSKLIFNPMAGDPFAALANYQLQLNSGTASTIVGPPSPTSDTRTGLSSAITNSVNAFWSPLIPTDPPLPPEPIGGKIENRVNGFRSGRATNPASPINLGYGGFSRILQETSSITGSNSIRIEAIGGNQGLGTPGYVDIIAGGDVGATLPFKSRVRITTTGSHTEGVLIDPISGKVVIQTNASSNADIILKSNINAVYVNAPNSYFAAGQYNLPIGSVGSDLCGAILLSATAVGSGSTSGNIDIYTDKGSGITTGPGNITLSTSTANTGLINFKTKGLISFQNTTQTLMTIDPANYQYRFFNQMNNTHCLSLNNQSALFTFEPTTVAQLAQGHLAVSANIPAPGGGCLQSLYSPNMLGDLNAPFVSKIFGKNSTAGNAILELYSHSGDSNWANAYEMKFVGDNPFISVRRGFSAAPNNQNQAVLFLSSRDFIRLTYYRGTDPVRYVELDGTNLTSSYIWKWPASPATVINSVLTSDSSGNLAWQSSSFLSSVTAVTATSPILSSGGSTPNISISSTAPISLGPVTITASTTPLTMNITGSVGGSILQSLRPSLAAGNDQTIVWGKALATNQTAVIRYLSGVVSTDSYMGLGFYGNDDLYKIIVSGNHVWKNTTAETMVLNSAGVLQVSSIGQNTGSGIAGGLVDRAILKVTNTVSNTSGQNYTLAAFMTANPALASGFDNYFLMFGRNQNQCGQLSYLAFFTNTERDSIYLWFSRPTAEADNRPPFIQLTRAGNVSVQCRKNSAYPDLEPFHVIHDGVNTSSAIAGFFTPNLNSNAATTIFLGRTKNSGECLALNYLYNTTTNQRVAQLSFSGGAYGNTIQLNGDGSNLMNCTRLIVNASAANPLNITTSNDGATFGLFASAAAINGTALLIGKNDSSNNGYYSSWEQNNQRHVTGIVGNGTSFWYTANGHKMGFGEFGLVGTNGVGNGVVNISGRNGNNQVMTFYNLSGTPVGSIIANTSTTTYNENSDYRLKSNIVPMTNTIDKILSLNCVEYNFENDPDKHYGFLAHELKEIIPMAVTGEKDAVDEYGKPIYQQVDYSKLTPYLAAAIKDLYSLVQTLQDRITILESQQ